LTLCSLNELPSLKAIVLTLKRKFAFYKTMKNSLLSNINNPTDLRLLDETQLPQVAQELRDFIIDIVAVKEGHLGASLGVIELTIALHYVFDTPNDLLIWEAAHKHRTTFFVGRR
jgi:deoxyxylulose-5-phosphate synthase